jgi:two-component system chemotaxis response regulator CheY
MRRCLIVDDSKIIRMVVRKIVQELDFDIDEASDAGPALEKCLESMPDVVILDWKLPGVDGIALLREIRALPDGDQTTILFCTTLTEDAHIQEALGAGANDYVIKPFDGETIRGKFASLGLL